MSAGLCLPAHTDKGPLLIFPSFSRRERPDLVGHPVVLVSYQLQAQSAIVLDNESKVRALVGDVISTVTLAGQISRELNVSDDSIDMGIEFKDDTGEATGQKLYLQLKSGDSYRRERKSLMHSNSERSLR